MARRFHFSLETLLRVRALREREAQRNFAARQAELAALEQLDRQTRDEIQRLQTELSDAQRSGLIDPAGLVRQRAWIGHLRRGLAERQVLKQGVVAQLDACRAALVAARRDREAVERLRERRFASWKRDTQRREQAAQDEVAQRLHHAAGTTASVERV